MIECDGKVGPDRELADPVGVLGLARVGEEVGQDVVARALGTDDPPVGDRHPERRRLDVAVARAEEVAEDAVGDVDAVHASRRGEDLAAGQVAPSSRG